MSGFKRYDRRKALPAHGEKRPFMVPGGHVMAQNDPPLLWKASSDMRFMAQMEGL